MIHCPVAVTVARGCDESESETRPTRWRLELALGLASRCCVKDDAAKAEEEEEEKMGSIVASDGELEDGERRLHEHERHAGIAPNGWEGKSWLGLVLGSY